MQQNIEIRNGVVIIALFFALALSLFLLHNYITKKVEDYGVFIVAKITNREKAKNGTDYSLTYAFKNKKYNTKFSTIPNRLLSNDSLLFLKILPDNPNTFVYVEEKVPACLTLKDSPPNGWKELPACQ